MVVRAGGTECGGALIDANHVITAAHCVQHAVGDVVFTVDGASSPRGILVASCHMQPHYTYLNRTCLEFELRDGRSVDAIVAELGDRCGILQAPDRCSPTDLDAGSDVAVLQLARPVPPAALAFQSPGPGGETFVDPVGLFEGLPTLSSLDGSLDLGPLLPDPGVFSQPGLRWLAPSEPVEWLPQGGTRLLALDAQLAPVTRLVETGQGLGVPPGQGGQGCPNPNTCDTTQFPQAAASTSSASAPTAAAPTPAGATPSPDTLVLSARRETFWTLQGDARARHGLVVAHPLDPNELYSVQHLALGHVLAATYRAQDDALYVLDEVTRGRGWRRRSQARLLRVSTDGSSSPEVLASWPRLSWNTRYALVAAPGDALWLAASPAPGRGLPLHVVLRLEPHASRHGRRVRWRATAWTLGRGTLAEVQPRADDRGLSLVVERRGQQEALGYAQADLHRLRRWELRRCF